MSTTFERYRCRNDLSLAEDVQEVEDPVGAPATIDVDKSNRGSKHSKARKH